MIEIKKLMNEFFIFFWRYRAIKLICNRVIHAFESVCRYLNYTLDLLYKQNKTLKVESQNGGKFKIRFYCQKIREFSRKIRFPEIVKKVGHFKTQLDLESVTFQV
jgi:transcriptional regulator CtsR